MTCCLAIDMELLSNRRFNGISCQLSPDDDDMGLQNDTIGVVL